MSGDKEYSSMVEAQIMFTIAFGIPHTIDVDSTAIITFVVLDI